MCFCALVAPFFARVFAACVRKAFSEPKIASLLYTRCRFAAREFCSPARPFRIRQPATAPAASARPRQSGKCKLKLSRHRRGEGCRGFVLLRAARREMSRCFALADSAAPRREPVLQRDGAPRPRRSAAGAVGRRHGPPRSPRGPSSPPRPLWRSPKRCFSSRRRVAGEEGGRLSPSHGATAGGWSGDAADDLVRRGRPSSPIRQS